MWPLCYFPFYGFIPRQRRNRAYLTGKALMPQSSYGDSMQDILDMTVPIVVETSGRTERAYDIFPAC